MAEQAEPSKTRTAAFMARIQQSTWCKGKSMLSDELKTSEEAGCVAAEYAARCDANEQKAKEFASRWFNMVAVGDRSASALERLLARELGIL